MKRTVYVLAVSVFSHNVLCNKHLPAYAYTTETDKGSEGRPSSAPGSAGINYVDVRFSEKELGANQSVQGAESSVVERNDDDVVTKSASSATTVSASPSMDSAAAVDVTIDKEDRHYTDAVVMPSTVQRNADFESLIS